MATSTQRSTTEAALVVATADGLHVPSRAEPELRDRRIGSLAIDGNTVWALVDSVELHHVTLDGSVRHVATLDDGTATCAHVHQGTVFVGGDDATLWRLGDGALEPVESFLDAPTRAEWSTPWGGAPSVLSMASFGDDLYVGVHVGGILRSADDGASWSDTIDLHVDVHEVVTDHDGTVWAATGERALAQSRDRGASWEFHTDGLHATYSLALAITSAGVVAGASSGHAGRDGFVYLFDGSRFAPVEGLPDRLGGAVGPRQIAAARGDHAALVAPGGAVYVSDDGGRHWHPVEHVTTATAIALVPSSGR